MLFILQKTVKSLQRHLHEFLDEMSGGQLFEPLSAGAITHARAKLEHTAFTELDQQLVIPSIYAPDAPQPIRRWHGHRLLGVDSSLVRTPTAQNCERRFSLVETVNQSGLTGAGFPKRGCPCSMGLLNRAGLDGRLEEPSRVGEVDLAIGQLARAEDLGTC